MAGIFGDNNSTKIFYSDLDINMTVNWNKDLVVKTNARAVSQSLVNIVSTKKGSMPFDPDFGSNVGSELFAVMTPFMMSSVAEDVTNTIRKYEPRVDYLHVDILPTQGAKNSITVTITFTTIYDVTNQQVLTFEMEQD